MFVAAAVCPHPPLLVPELAAGAAAEGAELRAVCLDAVRGMSASGADRVVVVGSASSAGSWDATAGGSLAGYGVAVTAGGPRHVLPLSLTVGAWLLDQATVRAGEGAVRAGKGAVRAGEGAVRAEEGAVRGYVAVASGTAPGDCARVGADLVAGSERTALLVMGDGSAKRGTESPGWLDDRAEGFDRTVVEALGRPDPETLLAVDVDLAEALWVAGLPAWQVLAGAARATYDNHPGSHIRARTTYDDAPYGVGYFVCEWQVESSAQAETG